MPSRETSVGVFADAEAVEESRRPAIVASPSVGAFDVSPGSSAPEGPQRTARADRAVTGAGFGTAVASEDGTSSASGSHRTVRRVGFGSRVAAAEPRRERREPVAKPEQPVEVLSKPKPVYTEEARQLRVEGEVVLEVLFSASGRLRVLRVLEGLGHGLDEAAMEAATRIDFKPARRDGMPVDHTAVLRVVFQLA